MSNEKIECLVAAEQTKLMDPVLKMDPEIEDGKECLCHSCSQCLDLNIAFRCRTCYNSSSCGELSSAEKFCSICIVALHLRQKHDVIDHRGFSPAVCDKHVNLLQYFCEDCKVLFCSQCTECHTKHDFKSVSAKACEVRKTVFAFISDFEELSKPIKHLEDIVERSFDAICQTLPSDETEFVKVIRDTLDRVIASKRKKWYDLNQEKLLSIESESGAVSEKDREMLKEVTARAESSFFKLKNVLNLSEENSTSKYQEIEKLLRSSISDQRKQLEQHVCLKWTKDLDVLFEAAIENAVSSIEVPELIKMTPKVVKMCTRVTAKSHQILNGNDMKVTAANKISRIFNSSNDVFGVVKSDGVVSFCVLDVKTGDPAHPQRWNLETFDLRDCEVESVFIRNNELAMCNKSNNVFVYDLKTQNIKCEFLQEKSTVPLDLIFWDDESFSCASWNVDRKLIEFYPESTPNDTLLLDEKPVLFRRSLNHYAVIDSTKNVTLFCPSKNLRLNINNTHHGLIAVDNMKWNSEKSLFLFDYKNLLVVEFQIDLESLSSMKCSLKNVFKVSFLSFPSQVKVDYMSVTGTSLFAYANSEISCANLSLP